MGILALVQYSSTILLYNIQSIAYSVYSVQYCTVYSKYLSMPSLRKAKMSAKERMLLV